MALGARPTGLGPGRPTGPGSSQSAQDQADVLRNPPLVNTTTQANPAQLEAYNRNASFEAGITNQTNEETQRELGRARDEISVGMESEGNDAASRGADPSFFRSKRLAQGKRDMHQLQGHLADASLNRHQDALKGVTDSASSMASEQRLSHLGSQAARVDEQRVANERADIQSRIYERPFDRFMQMTELAAKFGGGVGGGGGASFGGRGTGIFG